MKKTLLFFIFLFQLSFSFSQDKNFHRPDPQGITDFLSGKLQLSPQQQEKIKKAVEKKASEFDKINAKYIKKNEELSAIKKEMEPLETKLAEIYASLPETVIPFLDDAQKAKFDELRKPKKKTEPAAADSSQAPQSAVASDGKGKRKKIIKRKKSEAPAPASASAEQPVEKPDIKAEEKKEEPKPKEELDIFYP